MSLAAVYSLVSLASRTDTPLQLLNKPETQAPLLLPSVSANRAGQALCCEFAIRLCDWPVHLGTVTPSGLVDAMRRSLRPAERPPGSERDGQRRPRPGPPRCPPGRPPDLPAPGLPPPGRPPGLPPGRRPPKPGLTVRLRPGSTFSSWPLTSRPFISATAVLPSDSDGMPTKPKPRDSPVAPSRTIFTVATSPKAANISRSCSSVVSRGRFPT